MCGKTGTAQNHGEDHSIFVAFAPRIHPKIAIAVIVENGGQGAHWAAPIASYMVEKYLTDTIRRPMDEFNRIKNANLMPDLANYYSSSRRSMLRDSIKKAKADSLRKLPAKKSVSTKSKKINTIAYLAPQTGKRSNNE
jgi:penicillin-binding protein 2